MKRVTRYALAAYIAVGLVLGSLMFFSIPAMNVLGWAYYSVTWPAFIWHANTHIGPTPWVPPWAFTFPTSEGQSHEA